VTYSIAGARGKVGDVEAVIGEARKWAAQRGVEILLADARAVFGRDHLESAALHGLRARSTGTMIAHSVSMEALRYLAAQRQVADAMHVAGIRRDTDRVAALIFGAGSADEVIALLGWVRDDSVLDARGKDLANLGVRPADRGTVPPDRVADLALERLALVDVEK